MLVKYDHVRIALQGELAQNLVEDSLEDVAPQSGDDKDSYMPCKGSTADPSLNAEPVIVDYQFPQHLNIVSGEEAATELCLVDSSYTLLSIG